MVAAGGPFFVTALVGLSLRSTLEALMEVACGIHCSPFNVGIGGMCLSGRRLALGSVKLRLALALGYPVNVTGTDGVHWEYVGVVW